MAYRDRTTRGKADSFDYCVMRVTVTKKDGSTVGGVQTLVVTVDNHLETIKYVQKHLDACIANMVTMQGGS